MLNNLALGIAAVAVPLLALEAGYNATQIGLLIALSAIAQMVARAFMGAGLRKIPDKVFVIASCVLVAVACGILTVSTTLIAFALSELAQGVGRAIFWTGSQTHAIRIAKTAVGGLTTVTIAGSLGSMIGPVVAGLLSEHDPQLALAAGVGVGVLTLLPAFLLIKLPRFGSVRKEGGMVWRRPGVFAACWTALATGTWRALLSSYVPVALALAAQSASTIGILVAVGNASAILGSAISNWVRRIGFNGALLIGTIATGVGTIAFGPFAGFTMAATVALIVSGVGAGVLQTVGPAMATEVVHREERGDVIAAVGLFRAGGLFAAPAGMAAIVLVAPMSVAFLVVGALVMLPALALRSVPGVQADGQK